MKNVNIGRAIEIKSVADNGDIEGYGSTFGNVDQGYDVVEKGAFTDTLQKRGLPKMLWGHDFWEPPIGKWTDAEEDDRGLKLAGKLNLDMQRGSEIHSALKMGTVDGLSIGFIPVESDIAKSGVRHLTKVDLFEVSVVTFPMNEEARVDAVKHIVERGITERDLERILRDAGFSRTQAKGLIARGYDGILSRDANDDGVDDDGLRELFRNVSNTIRS